MAQNSGIFAGRVTNKTRQPLWVIWDEGDDRNKKWKGKLIAPGRMTPAGLDIDGVSTYYSGVKIAQRNSSNSHSPGTDQWWWLNNGAEVEIAGSSLLIISVVSWLGNLFVVQDSEVSGWGVSYDDRLDVRWGEPIK